MKVYSLKSCDTCRRAIKMLRASGQTPVVIDVLADALSKEEISRFLDEFGDDLVNRRSTTWRNLTVEERSMDHDELLADYPKLMKRPVIEHGGKLHLGWVEDVRAVLLG